MSSYHRNYCTLRTIRFAPPLILRPFRFELNGFIGELFCFVVFDCIRRTFVIKANRRIVKAERGTECEKIILNSTFKMLVPHIKMCTEHR